MSVHKDVLDKQIWTAAMLLREAGLTVKQKSKSASFLQIGIIVGTFTITKGLGLAYIDVAAEVALLSRVNNVTGLLAIEQSAGVVGRQSCPRFLILCVSGF